MDFADALGAVRREVVRDEETVVVRMRRSYATPIEDLWDAITDATRLSRWFLPIEGELRAGGSFQFKDNAGGEILRCEPPGLLQVSYGGETSLVEVRLTSEEKGTELVLEHSVPLELAGNAAGALYVGPGWDIAFLGLGLHLDGEVVADPVAWENSLPVQRYALRTVDAWAEAASGAATAEEIGQAAGVSRSQFAPEVSGDQAGDA
ncbi:SRPBCC family protein [Actinomadura sp. 9N407]|uniref:SRPBCC family protein n=1 Tax=Actinomadura sp. 9N407 TaxID=3375154 RepID=UPI0037A9680A